MNTERMQLNSFFIRFRCHSMEPTVKLSITDPQFFFSESFCMQLKFTDGFIEGWLVHNPIGLNLAESFRGIAIEEDGFMRFSFFIEWSNPNLEAPVLTAYLGEVAKSESSESRLNLEWLQVEDRVGLGTNSYKGNEVLFLLSERTPTGEAHRSGFVHLVGETLKRLYTYLDRRSMQA